MSRITDLRKDASENEPVSSRDSEQKGSQLRRWEEKMKDPGH